MSAWIKWGGGAALALLLAGAVAGYLEYREVAAQVEPMRERWAAAKDTIRGQKSRLRAWEAAWEDSVAVLDATRDSLEAEHVEARGDVQRGLNAAELAEENLGSSLQLLREQVRPALRAAVDTIIVQLDTVEYRHHEVQKAYERQIAALGDLRSQARDRRDHWRARSDSLASVNDQLHNALRNAEDERDAWKRKAKFDLLADGPRVLMHAGVGAGLVFLLQGVSGGG